MIEVTIGCQENTHNPNSDRMRSGYAAEEAEEVKGGGDSKESRIVGVQWPHLGGLLQSLPPWNWTEREL